jgi:hypothetical protein
VPFRIPSSGLIVGGASLLAPPSSYVVPVTVNGRI